MRNSGFANGPGRARLPGSALKGAGSFSTSCKSVSVAAVHGHAGRSPALPGGARPAQSPTPAAPSWPGRRALATAWPRHPAASTPGRTAPAARRAGTRSGPAAARTTPASGPATRTGAPSH
jgi:hypothetical protein